MTLTSQQRSTDARPAFTLVELLVVIGIIGLLVALLLPVMRGARRASQAAACAAQLKMIGYAVQAYANDNHGYIHRAQNRSSWLWVWAWPGEPVELRLIDPNALEAYWGTAYFPYVASRQLASATGEDTDEIIAFARRFWLCPSSVSVDPDFGNTDPNNPVSYGVNSMVISGTSTVSLGPPIVVTTTWAKPAKFKSPAEVIFCHDAAETRMDKRAGDTLSSYGGPPNLTSWRPGGALYSTKTDAVTEY